MSTTLRGVFLTSDAPDRLAEFYQRVAAVPIEEVELPGGAHYWRLDRDEMQLAIHDAKAFADYAHPPVAGSNLTHLYFKIDDQAALLERLATAGITPHAVDEVVVTVADPDGRLVMFGTA